jgi:hypothetical protein
MPAARQRRIFPFAMSVAETAEALGLQRSVLDIAIHSGELTTYTAPTGIRRPKILVRDLEKWIRKHWESSNDRSK